MIKVDQPSLKASQLELIRRRVAKGRDVEDD
jgi:hypothetical protein